MLRHATRITAIAAATCFAALASAQEEGDVDALFDALGLPEMLEIMREEGLSYGEEIGTDLMGRSTPEWEALVDDIYNLDNMRAEVRKELGQELEGEDVAAMTAFFTSEPGETIISLELAARRALLDDAVEEASKDVAAQAAMDETDRYRQLEAFVDANDLIETNVIGAMNANYAFYMGMMDGGALPPELTEDQILRDVYSQEPDIRSNTSEWVYSYLMLAYQPLSDDDLDIYIAFSESDAGQELNTAMFAAFDGMFESISRGLGLASAQFMQGEDI